jgi:hypothetical protein
LEVKEPNNLLKNLDLTSRLWYFCPIILEPLEVLMAHNALQPHLLINPDFWAYYLLSLPEINNSRVEDSGNTFCEQKDPKLTPEYINFMKDTPLASIEFEIPTEGIVFYIKNLKNNTKMAFSNRYSHAELRGESLRQQLTAIKQQNDQLSLYDALSLMVKDPEYTDLHKYLLSSIVLEGEDQSTKLILTQCSKVALSLLNNHQELTVDKLKEIYDEQHLAYFQNCPESTQKLSEQLQATANMLGRFLIQASTKHNEAEMTQLSAALRATYKLMPAYYNDGRIEFPKDYEQRVADYDLQASELAKNPDYAEFTRLRTVGVMMLALGVIALATFAVIVVFPPSALLMSQVIFHGAVGATAIEGGLVSAGLATAGLGFFATKSKITADQNMLSLSSLSTDIGINAMAAQAA